MLRKKNVRMKVPNNIMRRTHSDKIFIITNKSTTFHFVTSITNFSNN